MDVPQTRYARSDGVAIAYQTVGDGPFDLVYVPPVAQHVELAWESPRRADFMRRLASFSRLIVFDKRGTGMSDPVSRPTLEARMDDIRAVMDAVESERAAVFGAGDATPLCALFAATYPERTIALVLYGATPRFVRSREFPWLPTRAEQEELIEYMTARRLRGDPDGPDDPRIRNRSPSASVAEMVEFVRVNRLSVSPGAMAAYARLNLDVDVCAVLPTIHVPTLVLHRTGDRVYDVRGARFTAARIPGARLVELPGEDHIPLFGDTEALLSEVEAFLSQAHATEEDRGTAELKGVPGEWRLYAVSA